MRELLVLACTRTVGCEPHVCGAWNQTTPILTEKFVNWPFTETYTILSSHLVVPTYLSFEHNHGAVAQINSVVKIAIVRHFRESSLWFDPLATLSAQLC